MSSTGETCPSQMGSATVTDPLGHEVCRAGFGLVCQSFIHASPQIQPPARQPPWRYAMSEPREPWRFAFNCSLHILSPSISTSLLDGTPSARPVHTRPARMGQKHSMRICIPTSNTAGLESLPYAHFGSAPYFIMHNVANGQTEVLINNDQEHAHGHCHPIEALRGRGVDVVVVGGIGARALERLNVAGIKVFQAKAGSVRENIEALQQGQLGQFTLEAACRQHQHPDGTSAC